MGIEQKGIAPFTLERIEIDRIGFVSASVKRILPSAPSSGGAIDDLFTAGTNTGIGSAIGLPIPTDFPDIVGAVPTRGFVENENGVATLRWLYEGIAKWVGDEDEALMWFSFGRVLNTVPIQAHPNFKSWVGKYGTLDDMGNWLPFSDILAANVKPLQGTGTTTAPNPLLGADSYYTCGGVWSARYSARKLDDGILTGTGTIIETADLPQNELQKPPNTPVDDGNVKRNWLYTGPELNWKGNAWEVVEQYVLSGRGGWVPLIYTNGQ